MIALGATIINYSSDAAVAPLELRLGRGRDPQSLTARQR